MFATELSATPDGRHAGEAICCNYSPTPCYVTMGITAALHSASKGNLPRGVVALPVYLTLSRLVKINYSKVVDPLMEGYVQHRLPIINFSIVNVEELEDARIYPNQHRDLVVRIWGYNAYSTDLDGHEGHYAPQTFKDEHGRQLLMNWLTERSRGSWKGIKGWAGCQGLPKELYLDGNILKMRVIPKIEKLVVSREVKQLPLSRYEAGEQYRLQVDAILEPDGSVEVELLSTADGKEKTMIYIHGNGRMVVDRFHSSMHPTHHSLLERRISLPGGQITLEVYVDHAIRVAGFNCLCRCAIPRS